MHHHQHLPPAAAFVNPNKSSSQPPPPLKRATYIHISDLTSAYNIDNTRLEEELKRVQMLVDPSLDAEEASVVSHAHRRLQSPRNGYNLCV
jgi:hypothetical protein